MIRASTLGRLWRYFAPVRTTRHAGECCRAVYDLQRNEGTVRAIAVCGRVVLAVSLMGYSQVPSTPAATPTIGQGSFGSVEQSVPPDQHKKKGHFVELKWSASATRDIAGYYVFRAEGGADESTCC